MVVGIKIMAFWYVTCFTATVIFRVDFYVIMALNTTTQFFEKRRWKEWESKQDMMTSAGIDV